MNAWQEYKKKLGNTRPWDMLNSEVKRVSKEEEEKRFAICKECPEFIKITTQCKQCGCIMKAKTKLAEATCPIGRW